MVRAVLAVSVLTLGACTTPSARILPAALPQALVPYAAEDRSFMAPAGGQLIPRSDDILLQYEGPATLMVTSVSKKGVSMSEADIARMLRSAHHSLGSARLAKEESPDAALFCVENRPLAACARIDADAGVIVLSTFEAAPALYDSLGGARLAAEAARTAKGFHPEEALPPP